VASNIPNTGFSELNVTDFVECIGITDTGRVREENQDTFAIVNHRGVLCCIVCDGMGGPKGGRRAASMASQFIKEGIQNLESPDSNSIKQTVFESIKKANEAILAASIENVELAGMGTTCLVACFFRTELHIFSVGDSRLYRIREGNVQQLTEDHTLVAELMKAGLIQKTDNSTHLISHILTRSVGPSSNLQIDYLCLPDGPVANDVYVLCSDGLYNCISEKDLTILAAGDLENGCRHLIEKSNSNGGFDNITIVAVRFKAAFPVHLEDISVPQVFAQPHTVQVVEAVDDIFSPVLAEYLRQIKNIKEEKHHFKILISIALASVMTIWIWRELETFYSLKPPSQQEQQASQVFTPKDQSQLDLLVKQNFLKNRLDKLYTQLDIISAALTQEQNKVVDSLQKQKEALINQINQKSTELENTRQEFKYWSGLQTRMTTEDLVNLASEVGKYNSQLKTLSEQFQVSTWAYLNALNNQKPESEINKLFLERREREDLLKKSLTDEVQRKVNEFAKKLQASQLEFAFFKRKLADLDDQIAFFSSMQNAKDQGLKVARDKILQEILTLEAELVTLNKQASKF